jgi:hypothetical protein
VADAAPVILQTKSIQLLAAFRETARRPNLRRRHLSAHTRHIAIDVRVDGDEISGQAGDGTAQPRPFRGWVGLIGALDRLLESPTTEKSH